MNYVVRTVLAIVFATATVSPVLAHEETYKGKAIALKTAKSAQSSGEIHKLEVTVIDSKTKKPVNRVFTITAETLMIRDGKRIKAGEANVKKGEEIAVVVDHDEAPDEAIEVRLTTRR